LRISVTIVSRLTEKSLKGLLIALDIESPRTHNIGNLFRLLHNAGVFIPQPVLAGSALTEYAVNTRYPGDYDPVSEEDYENALFNGRRGLFMGQIEIINIGWPKPVS
jgi:Uncharacterized conserved protein related to C-terminal domain of eukaryotic chaperone, SACSIN